MLWVQSSGGTCICLLGNLSRCQRGFFFGRGYCILQLGATTIFPHRNKHRGLARKYVGIYLDIGTAIRNIQLIY